MGSRNPQEPSLPETNLLNIVEIRTISKVSQHEVPDKEINKLLDKGWKILKIHTTCYDCQLFPNEQAVHVTLGRPQGVLEDEMDGEETTC